jgi:O-antigen/teichoic acid export membrane protein
LRQLYLRSSKIVAACACFPALAVLLLSEEILTYWIDPAFAGQAKVPLQILSVAFLVNCLGHIPYVVSQAIGHPELSARFSSLNAGLTLLLFLVGIPLQGTVGAALALLASQMIVVPSFIGSVNRQLGISGGQLVREGLPSIVVATGIACLVLQFLRVEIASFVSLAAIGGLATTVYIALAASFVLDTTERTACWTVVNRAFGFGGIAR